jgi:hypothetical protein
VITAIRNAARRGDARAGYRRPEGRLRRRVLTALGGVVLACVISFVTPPGLWAAGPWGAFVLLVASVAWGLSGLVRDAGGW